MEFKISQQQEKLRAMVKTIRERVDHRLYPITYSSGMSSAGYWMRGLNLASDIDRLFRAWDMLESLQGQRLAWHGYDQQLLTGAAQSFDQIQIDVKTIYDVVKLRAKHPAERNITKLLKEGKSPQEIQDEIFRSYSPQASDRYYESLLQGAVEQADLRFQQMNQFLQYLEEKQSKS